MENPTIAYAPYYTGGSGFGYPSVTPGLRSMDNIGFNSISTGGVSSSATVGAVHQEQLGLEHLQSTPLGVGLTTDPTSTNSHSRSITASKLFSRSLGSGASATSVGGVLGRQRRSSSAVQPPTSMNSSSPILTDPVNGVRAGSSSTSAPSSSSSSDRRSFQSQTPPTSATIPAMMNTGDSHLGHDEDETGVAVNGGAGGDIDEEPLYVNARQYHRILKRRAARARLAELHRLSNARKPYLHQSRHNHAVRRPRGPGGRFLTAEEIAARKLQEQQVNEQQGTTDGQTGQAPGDAAGNGVDTNGVNNEYTGYEGMM